MNKKTKLSLISFLLTSLFFVSQKPAFSQTASSADSSSVLGTTGGGLGTASTTPIPTGPSVTRDSIQAAQGHDHLPGEWDLSLGPDLSNGGTGFSLSSDYYCPINKEFYVGLTTDFHLFNSNITNLNIPFVTNTYIEETMLMLKYIFPGKDFRPYLLGGGGIDILITNSAKNIFFTPGFALGGGIDIPLNPDINLFVQAKFNFVFSDISTSGTYGSIVTNSTQSFSFIPLAAGITFPFFIFGP